MKLEQEFGLILRYARLQAGLTQNTLAKIMSTKQPSISRAERGDVTSVRFMIKWVEACGFNLSFHHVSVETEDHTITFFLGDCI